jgi:hypothetical protein
MKIQAKKSSEQTAWKVVSVNEVALIERTGPREMSEETKILIDKVQALKPGQALKIPRSYIVEREYKGYKLVAVRGYNTVAKKFPVVMRRDSDGAVWLFRLTEQEARARAERKAARAAARASAAK